MKEKIIQRMADWIESRMPKPYKSKEAALSWAEELYKLATETSDGETNGK